MSSRSLRNNKAYLLFVVLSTIIIVTLFASIILSIMVSQARLTKHETSRVQAYYAGFGGLYYAVEKLRLSDPAWGGNVMMTHHICRSACEINDPDLPSSIRDIKIEISPRDPANRNLRTVKITTDYTLP